jgi:hypothetical protein
MLDKLAKDIGVFLEMIGPLSDNALMEMSKDDGYVTSILYSADRSSVRNFFADLGHFALSQFNALTDDDKQRLESAVGKLFLSTREGIANISAERAPDN